LVWHLKSLISNTTQLCISIGLDHFVWGHWHLRLAHLVYCIIFSIKRYQNLICHPAYFKLELDAFVFSLSLDRIFSLSFNEHGYPGWHDHLVSLFEAKISIAAHVALFIMDSICYIFKFIHICEYLKNQSEISSNFASMRAFNSASFLVSVCASLSRRLASRRCPCNKLQCASVK